MAAILSSSWGSTGHRSSPSRPWDGHHGEPHSQGEKLRHSAPPQATRWVGSAAPGAQDSQAKTGPLPAQPGSPPRLDLDGTSARQGCVPRPPNPRVCSLLTVPGPPGAHSVPDLLPLRLDLWACWECTAGPPGPQWPRCGVAPESPTHCPSDPHHRV